LKHDLRYLASLGTTTINNKISTTHMALPDPCGVKHTLQHYRDIFQKNSLLASWISRIERSFNKVCAIYQARRNDDNQVRAGEYQQERIKADFRKQHRYNRQQIKWHSNHCEITPG
jgi:hypothetical protein